MTKDFALKLFEGFSIHRWTDLVTPFDIVEMDKAAEKMVVAYIIGKYEENRGEKIDWQYLIYGSLFDLLRKIALCDIKSPVQNLIKNEYPEEYRKLNEWVLCQYRDLIDDKELFAQFEAYIKQLSSEMADEEKTKSRKITERVLKASNKYASLRELEMLSPVNEPERVEYIRKELNSDLQHYLDLRGLQLLVTKQKPFEFLMRIEQLRFQKRWNQTPRVPETSVLGHCFFVAILTLLFEMETGKSYCQKRMYNNYFSALFHDMPESVTRDIISPVKQATDGLPLIIKNIEDQIVQQELVPLMEDFYRDEVMYFISDEFSNRIQLEDQNELEGFEEIVEHLESYESVGLRKTANTKNVSYEDLMEKYNEDKYNPVDGKLVRLADHFSALLEADASMKHGITSAHLEEGKANLISLYTERNGENAVNSVNWVNSVNCVNSVNWVNGIDAAALFGLFQ